MKQTLPRAGALENDAPPPSGTKSRHPARIMIRCGGAANKTVDHNSNRFVLCEINTRKVQTAYSHSEMHSRSC